MYLDRSEFVVIYDGSELDEAALTKVVKDAGFEAEVVTGAASPVEATSAEGPSSQSNITQDALARAKKDGKPIVLDFHAEWCLPCKRMEMETFSDPAVARLLEQCVFLRIDTDQHPELAKRFGVVGLPDIRFLRSDGAERGKMLGFQESDPFVDALTGLLDEANHVAD